MDERGRREGRGQRDRVLKRRGLLTSLVCSISTVCSILAPPPSSRMPHTVAIVSGGSSLSGALVLSAGPPLCQGGEGAGGRDGGGKQGQPAGPCSCREGRPMDACDQPAVKSALNSSAFRAQADPDPTTHTHTPSL